MKRKTQFLLAHNKGKTTIKDSTLFNSVKLQHKNETKLHEYEMKHRSCNKLFKTEDYIIKEVTISISHLNNACVLM